GATANINPGRANMNALVAVDAVAGRLSLLAQRLAFLDRRSRLAAIIAVGDIERMLIGQRRLDARPRAHVETDLLAHMARERIGRERQDPDPQIGDEWRLKRRQILHQRWRIREVEHPGAAGPP